MNKNLITLSVIVSLICALFFLFFKTGTKEQTTSEQQKHVFRNFSEGTEIIISYKNKDQNIIQIQNNTETYDLDPSIKNISYIVKEDASSYNVNIGTITDTEFFISGLKPQTKIQITSNNQPVTQVLPTDWVGQIAVINIKGINKNDYCLKIFTKSTPQICHIKTIEVAS